MAPLILRLLAGAGTAAALFGQAAAQFPPTPEGVTVIKSKYNENITISYKEVRSIISSRDHAPVVWF